jgi:hypothetical protein
MCMALTNTKPSLIPLSLRHSSTCGVILMKACLAGTLNHNSLRYDFTIFPFLFAKKTVVLDKSQAETIMMCCLT